MKVRLIIFVFLFIFFNNNAQVFLSEGFESGIKPSGWTDVPVVGSVLWRYQTGGYTKDPAFPFTKKPPTAHSGTYNALFQIAQSGPKTKLVTAPINLSTAKRPELTFWHAQYEWGATEFDKLRVYYKVHADSAWHLIGSYLELTEAWTQRSIFLPYNHLSSTYYLAFEGESNWGWGEVLDDIQVIERGIIPMNLKSYTIESSNDSIVPSGEKNIPITKIYFNVYGNAGQLRLDTLKFTSLNSDIADIENSGVKLYITSTPVFKTTTQIGSGVNFSNGIAKFSNLNYSLAFGDNYVWLTYDVKDAANYGNVLDAKLAANSIDLHFDTTGVAFDANLYLEGDSVIYIVGGVRSSAPLYYHIPNSETSPTGNIKIYESVFYDDFSSDKDWTLNEDFERAAPQGKGGTYGGNPDPATAYSVPNVLGTDLSGLGAIQGDYENGVSSEYWAESPASNCSYYNNLRLIYKRWLSIESTDLASIQVSPDSGQTWIYVWYSFGNISEGSWGSEVVDLSSFNLDRKNGIMTRFTLGPTDASFSRSGWNIDNFAVAGNYIESDVGVSELKSPLNGCGHTNHDTIKVMVKNYGAEDVTEPIPIAISFNGGSTYIRDTLTSGIPFGDSVLFTFGPIINLSVSAVYNTIVKTVLANDEDNTNDGLTTKLYVQPTINPSYFETFESSSGMWMPGGTSPSWEWGIPEGSLNPVPSGIKVWDTKLLGNYNNNEYSYIESPCFNFANADRQLLKFSYWLSAELEKDGFNVYYSTDDGKNWELLDTNNYNWPWPWYNDTIKATGERGWVGGDASWHRLQQLIPDDLSLAAKGKIRFVFQSDSSVVTRGLAIDNVQLEELPPDIGVSSFPAQDTCQYILPENPEVYIRNYGISTLDIDDTIIVGLDFNSEPPIIDTFLLTQEIGPGDSLLYSFKEIVDIINPQSYSMLSYTLIEDDPFYFFGNNDSASTSFDIWLSPVTLLQDTISSRLPDTVFIRPHYEPEYSFLWDDNSTDSVYDVSVPRTYYLTVTESVHGCQTYDSIYIQLLFNDVGIDSIIWPRSSCELGDAEKIQVQIRNSGTDSLIAGDKIRLFYEFNSGVPIQDSLTLSSSFHKGTSRWFTFNNDPVDMHMIGDYTIKAYTYFGGDTIPDNDTIFRTISVYGYPVLNLGKDTTVVALSYTIEADPSFADYLWNDGDTNSTKIIDVSGFYWLDIIDNNGCPASDSIDIWLKIRDIQTLAIINPVSSCNRAGTDPVSIEIENNGTDTVFIADNILLSYKLDENTRVNDTIHINNFLPGQTYMHSFAGTIDLTGFGTYNLEVTATTLGDLRTANDTLYAIVNTRANPVVDFGIEDYQPIKATQYVLDAGSGVDYVYLWQDGSANQTFTATEIGEYSVIVTDVSTGCVGGDTVQLYLDILDYRATAIGINTSTCAGIYEDIPVTLLNNGNLPRGSANLTLKYMSGNSLLFTENYNSSTNWSAAASRIYLTQNAINLNTTGSKQLKVIVLSTGDLRPENDTLKKTVNVLPNPVVNFGGDVLYVTLPYILNAGSGQASYLWSDGSTNSTLTVTEDGVYSVTVTGTNGCVTTKDVGINVGLFVSDLAAQEMKVTIYPVPATDFVTVEAEFEHPGEFILEIIDAQDRIIDAREITDQSYKDNLYIGNYSPGIYFIRIRNNEMYHVSRMIIR